MVAVKQVGGKSGNSFQWQGATVLRSWEAQIQAGFEAEAEEIETDLKATLHRDSGEMAEDSYAVVEVRGARRTLRAGSTAPYTAFHELGTVNYPAHPQIRSVIDAHAPHVTQKIRESRGLG